MKKLKPRKTEQPTEKHSAGGDQKLDLNSRHLNSESKLIIFITHGLTWLTGPVSPE